MTLTTNVSHGTLDFRGSGAFRYRPNDGFVGTDSFTYTVDNSTATVTINVTNTAPTGVPDQYTLSHDEKFVVLVSDGVLANDTDPEDDFLTASLVSTTSHGTLALSSNGTFTYTPNSGFIGTDTFTYRPSDGLVEGAPVTVTLIITNATPWAQTDYYSIPHDSGSLVVTPRDGVLANDTDGDNDLLSAVLVSGPNAGTLVLQPSGAFRYTPPNGFTGQVTFTYKANDGIADSNVATVTINVTNMAPVAANDFYSVLHDGTLIRSHTDGVLANDSDGDNDPLTAALGQRRQLLRPARPCPGGGPHAGRAGQRLGHGRRLADPQPGFQPHERHPEP